MKYLKFYMKSKLQEKTLFLIISIIFNIKFLNKETLNYTTKGKRTTNLLHLFSKKLFFFKKIAHEHSENEKANTFCMS